MTVLVEQVPPRRDRAGGLRAPFFEIGPKSRLRLAQLELLARAAGRSARKHGVQVVLTVPVALIGPLRRADADVTLFAQGMDPDPMGDGMGRVYAESLVDAGADGVMLNHDGDPLTRSALRETLRRTVECGLDSIVCAATEADVLELVRLRPSAILFEPPDLIGTASAGDRPWIGRVDDAARAEAPGVLMMHAGGVSSPEVARRIMRAGADATGSTSGVLGAVDPLHATEEFIAAAREGWDAADGRRTTTAVPEPESGRGGGAA